MGELACVRVYESSSSLELVVEPATAVDAVKKALAHHEASTQGAVLGDVRSSHIDEAGLRQVLSGVARVGEWTAAQPQNLSTIPPNSKL